MCSDMVWRFLLMGAVSGYCFLLPSMEIMKPDCFVKELNWRPWNDDNDQISRKHCSRVIDWDSLVSVFVCCVSGS